jgi:hypothetical protein
VNLRNLPPFQEGELIATEDPQPIPPLITPCIPDPWLVQDGEAVHREVSAPSPEAEPPKLITEVDLNLN